MNKDTKLNSDILIEDFKQFEDDFEQKYGLDQLLSVEQGQAGLFGDGFEDEIMVGLKDDVDAALPVKAEDKTCQKHLTALIDEDNPRKNCHLVSEKRRRNEMRSTFTYLGELIIECQPRKRSKAEILSSTSKYIAELDRQNREIENSVLALRAEVARIYQM